MPRAKALDPKRRGEFLLFLKAGNTVKDTAAYFDISEATAYREIKALREKIGPWVPRDRKQYARWHLIARNSHLIEKA